MMWFFFCFLLTVFLVKLLYRLHLTTSYVKTNQAYYVYYSFVCKYHLQHVEQFHGEYSHEPVTLGIVACLWVMQLYGYYHVTDYAPAIEPLVRHEEFCLGRMPGGDYVLVYKGMSSNVDYYRTMFDDDMRQLPVLVDGRAVRVIGKWWNMVNAFLADGRVEQVLKQSGKLWVFGFSRGGVLAEYTALRLKQYHQQIGLCTLGKPMAGDREYVAVMDALYASPEADESLLGRNVRCVVVGDPIVTLPLASFTQKSEGWYPTQMQTAVWLEHKNTDYLWKYHTLRTYYRALMRLKKERTTNV